MNITFNIIRQFQEAKTFVQRLLVFSVAIAIKGLDLLEN